jgi:hypothetical protein
VRRMRMTLWCRKGASCLTGYYYAGTGALKLPQDEYTNKKKKCFLVKFCQSGTIPFEEESWKTIRQTDDESWVFTDWAKCSWGFTENGSGASICVLQTKKEACHWQISGCRGPGNLRTASQQWEIRGGYSFGDMVGTE